MSRVFDCASRYVRERFNSALALGQISEIVADLIAANDFYVIGPLSSFFVDWLHVVAAADFDTRSPSSDGVVDAVLVSRRDFVYRRMRTVQHCLVKETVPIGVKRSDVDPALTVVVGSGDCRRVYGMLDGVHYRLSREHPGLLAGRRYRFIIPATPSGAVYYFSKGVRVSVVDAEARIIWHDRDAALASLLSEADNLIMSPMGTWVRCGCPVWNVSGSAVDGYKVQVKELGSPWIGMFPLLDVEFAVMECGSRPEIMDEVKILDATAVDIRPRDLLLDIGRGMQSGQFIGSRQEVTGASDPLLDHLMSMSDDSVIIERLRLLSDHDYDAPVRNSLMDACLRHWEAWSKRMPNQGIDDPDLASLL
jgi:hypothetical protein